MKRRGIYRAPVSPDMILANVAVWSLVVIVLVVIARQYGAL